MFICEQSGANVILQLPPPVQKNGHLPNGCSRAQTSSPGDLSHLFYLPGVLGLQVQKEFSLAIAEFSLSSHSSAKKGFVSVIRR